MSNYLLLAFSMTACLLGGIFKKYCGSKFENKQAMYHGFNAVTFVTCAISLIIAGGIGKISIYTLLMGTAFGIITALQSVFTLKAYEKGPFSYTSVIASLSTIIPTLSGAMFWNESISKTQISGIILMIFCFICSVDFKNDEKSTNKSWLLYVFFVFVTTGLIGVMQKIHQTSEYKNELNGFLIIAFVISFVYSLISWQIITKNPQKYGFVKSKTDFSAKMIIIMIISGICIAINNKVNLKLSGEMDAAVFFPTVNGGGLILSTLASVIIFREKLTIAKWAGVVIGITSVVLLCI